MRAFYDLYIDGHWAAQYRRKKDAVSDARTIFNNKEILCNSVEVVKCNSYDARDGGETVYSRYRKKEDK